MTVSTTKDEVVGDAISIVAFADLITSMSRFLTRLSTSHPFKEADIGVPEWLGLVTVQAKAGLSNKQFAKQLGITGQRAAQIGDALKRAGLISVVQSAGDARTNEMTITKEGEARLRDLNGKLMPILAENLKGKERLILRTQKGVATLLRILRGAADADDGGASK